MSDMLKILYVCFLCFSCGGITRDNNMQGDNEGLLAAQGNNNKNIYHFQVKNKKSFGYVK